MMKDMKIDCSTNGRGKNDTLLQDVPRWQETRQMVSCWDDAVLSVHALGTQTGPTLCQCVGLEGEADLSALF